MNFNEIEVDDGIIEALENDKLVVFVGAGVSRGRKTNCPDFSELAEGIAKDLVEETKKVAKEKIPVEQYLGALERKYSIETVIKTSEDVIYGGYDQKPSGIRNMDLEPNKIHYDIVKLLYGLKKRNVRIVTTNFEHYLTKAYTDVIDGCEGKKIYYAPALPNGQDFSGLVYLHGAYEDKSVGREFVLTDRGFGRAYLTSGYANKFIQELFSSEYTVLFVGYSYGDIVMRYLTRALGINKNKLYVFADYEVKESRNKVEEYWDGMDVTSILYKRKENDHSNLDKALAAFSEYVNMTSEDHKKRIAELCKEISLGSSTNCSYLKLMVTGREYTSVFTDNSMNREHLGWAESKGLLLSILHYENNNNCESLYSWAIDRFFDYPEEFFRIKQSLGGIVSGYFWLRMVRKFSDYIEDNYPNIDVLFLKNRLESFVPFILEYNPINLSLINDSYQFVITGLSKKLFMIDDEYCFGIAMKLFLYLTTPHTTSIYNSHVNKVTKDVRFYGQYFSMNEIADQFTKENYQKLTRLHVESIVRNLEHIRDKFDNIGFRSFEHHINNQEEGFCLVTILKGVVGNGRIIGSELYRRVRNILNIIEDRDEIYSNNKSSAFWVSYNKQAEIINVEFMKSKPELVNIWIGDNEQFRLYCINSLNFKISDGANIFRALVDAFKDDPRLITDIICSLDVLPDEVCMAIPSAFNVDSEDTIVMQCIEDLLGKSGNDMYYESVLNLLLHLANNDEWCRNNIDEIEMALETFHKLLKSSEDEPACDSEIVGDYLTTSLNSLGGKYGKLITLALICRYRVTCDENDWEEIPDEYSSKINEVLQGSNSNFKMARVMVYSNLYNYSSLDLNSKLAGLFDGLYWEQGCSEDLFIQAWHGFIWYGQLQPKNIECVFDKGILECIRRLKYFSDDMQRVLISYLIVIATNVETIEKEEVISAFIGVIKGQHSIDGHYSMVFQRIINHFDEIKGAGFINEWREWLKSLVKKRVTCVPAEAKLMYSELRCIASFLFYIDCEYCEDLLGYIEQAISSMDFTNIGSYSLPISKLRHNTELDDQRRVVLARAFRLCVPILAHGKCFSLKDDLMLIVYNNGTLVNEVFEIVKIGINESKIPSGEKERLIGELTIDADDNYADGLIAVDS